MGKISGLPGILHSLVFSLCVCVCVCFDMIGFKVCPSIWVLYCIEKRYTRRVGCDVNEM
jgi:hypothetical protein